MKLALHLNDYSHLGPPEAMGPALVDIAKTAENVGFARLSTTDHLWQISLIGEENEPMLEAYTVLAFLAGSTSTIELQTLVTAATYRAPGLLAKIVTTLDVLSGGRAWLGIGTGWNEQEATGLGLPFDHHDGRFRRLKETLEIVLQMWSDSEDKYVTENYQLGQTMNVPAPVSTPRPRILLGGGGELRTLKLVAKYADAMNVWGGEEAAQKIKRLNERCEEIGRDPSEIEKTALIKFDIEGEGGADAVLADLRRLHDLGFATVYGAVPDLATPEPLEVLGSKVIPEVNSW
ncbi:TIGR03560 family F420-dependent LLM class oxidoreductase [Rhodococcus fascians]|nr:TIGR03560 family F420-dependent LLM class oxidoreductase [Rhodococcus fascians]MBY4140943.1 TIGR03560 family F420-dependent LLM class oxidoreductase [Rhodococcus fascians]MBY4219607.1 TIGR03560 family F420-dependent LLM class oxidoreductase [Rhodococcus fascians]MBY4221916.1 TIGR03560 family F420-dependent LLM class oxidoreductase [Rhodococcus fascians]MBY4233917.1 TIGR03560 family F420-dependent LLM class oxidoreductase [Rhodococcus fascians]